MSSGAGFAAMRIGTVMVRDSEVPVGGVMLRRGVCSRCGGSGMLIAFVQSENGLGSWESCRCGFCGDAHRDGDGP